MYKRQTFNVTFPKTGDNNAVIEASAVPTKVAEKLKPMESSTGISVDVNTQKVKMYIK